MTSPKPPVFDHGGDEHQIHLLAGGDGGGHCRGRRSGRDGRSCCCGGGCARGRRGRRRRRRPRRLRRRGSWFRCCCLPRCCWRRRRGSRRRKRRRRRRWLGAPAFLPLRRRRRVRGNGHGLLAPHQVTRIACSVGDGGIVEGLHELALQLLALLDLRKQFLVEFEDVRLVSGASGRRRRGRGGPNLENARRLLLPVEVQSQADGDERRRRGPWQGIHDAKGTTPRRCRSLSEEEAATRRLCAGRSR